MQKICGFSVEKEKEEGEEGYSNKVIHFWFVKAKMARWLWRIMIKTYLYMFQSYFKKSLVKF